MLFWTVTILLIAAAVAAVAMIVLNQRNGGGGFAASFFAPKAEKRLAIMEHASVDNRRKLILVRRDNVEHLIMTGGPVDVVIETGIGAGRPRASVSDLAESTPVFTRQPRTFGQAVNE